MNYYYRFFCDSKPNAWSTIGERMVNEGQMRRRGKGGWYQLEWCNMARAFVSVKRFYLNEMYFVHFLKKVDWTRG